MFRKVLIVVLAGSLLIAGSGCAKKEAENNPTGQQGMPGGAPSNSAPAKPINGDEVAEKVNKALDAKFPGNWEVSGDTLKKGSYTENNNYGIADEVLKVYPGAMVSIFVGEKRISSTITDSTQKGARVLEGYPTPEDVPATMKSGKIKVTDAGAMGSSSFQKVYLPLKSGDKTVAVMTISISQ